MLAACLFDAAAAQAGDFVRVPGGVFRSALPVAKGQYETKVAPFELQARPVTNAQFLSFVAAHPEWGREQVPAVLADREYLSHWAGARKLSNPPQGVQPVTRVSWFAAQAYCEAQGARLPGWYEWEFAAAASTTTPDARAAAAWRQEILDWYAKPASGDLAAVGQRPANVFGVKDLHGLVWEWVEDAGSLMAGEDSRAAGDPELAKFCGSGALTLEQKENYAVLMRIALLSSLRASDTTRSLGFRCARDAEAR